ncbi:MAG: 2-amino-4-hydroxy-6-hydroxymethyldihydropteridine diphosphokinase [Thermodesulfovibrio sp.]|nr:2-amino-4-hydroxy-6-hydroxymethyldihydropteridine diphosphokinase [Thermodesulfovibrio sp.]MCX7723961.1 2-amino-4-hydroxy-6-hydroxymethyldihydropteridine diphosphokinase [Thermodesulfovibrio sp.]MDW7972140.1 2-amino-4-hydroxy-6-hydroxymethyldihydropteridine diphosphokinase [Thermodesulfovibrio sp.]
MHKVYLLLGSNLGNREKNIEKAINELMLCGVRILKKSSLYNTAPWGYTEQPDFLNQAVEGLTSFEPTALLREIKKIERKMGRVETLRYGPRVIDIDIIFYDNIVFESKDLVIPHPLMHKREFVLKPLCEIAPDFIHPKLNLSVKKLLENL